MYPARTSPPDRNRAARGKRAFAKRVADFANRVPGFPVLWIACAAAGGLMTVTGGFGSLAMPIGRRTLFWALLMLWSATKWQLWFALTVRTHRDWLRASLIGAVLLSLPLPLEISAAAHLAGYPGLMPDLLGTWSRSAAIGAVILATIYGIGRATRWRAFVDRTPPPPEGGLLDRARVAPDALAAIEAEDHYCRVRRRDGSDALIHYRFGDALAEVAAIDGVQVHRGAWVAAGAVTSAGREGRRWILHLSEGSRIAVSATHLPQVRARGWLANRG